MVDVDKLNDAELRTKLMEFGFPALPITGTTRKVMVKKLKLLMENKNPKNIDSRRSLGKYSSEDDSDTEVKTVRNKRRVTMAAPPMQPPAKPPTLKKTTRIVETTIEEDIPKTTQTTSVDVSSSRTSRIIKNAQNDYDTGSDSESEIIRSSQISSSGADKSSGKNYQYTSSYNSAGSSLRESPKKSLDTSYSRTFSSSLEKPAAFSSPVLTESSSDRLNQIRSRMSLGTSGIERNTYSTPTVENNWNTIEKEQTPFLSNFTKRLSQISASKYRNEVIKEQDTNGATSYLRNPQYNSVRGSLRPREYQDYSRANRNDGNFLKDNLVPFTVLLVALLFFLFVGFIYLGMRSDTSLETTGKAPLVQDNPYEN